ncbi:hypothetical protein [Streptomyces sp. NPDC094031]|uniref:hypothetical protein n=1 Tax=Streptomyces sp. NPDC094031 TaxID=3155307 RepID=UPI003328957E
MSEEQTARTPDPVRQHPPLIFAMTKGGQPKRDEPGSPSALSQVLALQLATRGTGGLVTNLDRQRTPPGTRWTDQ